MFILPAIEPVYVKKIDETFNVPASELSHESNMYLWRYGAKQASADRIAGISPRDFPTWSEFRDHARPKVVGFWRDLRHGIVPGMNRPTVDLTKIDVVAVADSCRADPALRAKLMAVVGLLNDESDAA